MKGFVSGVVSSGRSWTKPGNVGRCCFRWRPQKWRNCGCLCSHYCLPGDEHTPAWTYTPCTTCSCAHDCSHCAIRHSHACPISCSTKTPSDHTTCPYLYLCHFYVCKSLPGVCVHRHCCLLSVRVLLSVFFLLNYWWDCNSNSSPPISPPAVCHQLTSSRRCSQQKPVCCSIKAQTTDQPWKLRTAAVCTWTKREQTVTVASKMFYFCSNTHRLLKTSWLSIGPSHMVYNPLPGSWPWRGGRACAVSWSPELSRRERCAPGRASQGGQVWSEDPDKHIHKHLF